MNRNPHPVLWAVLVAACLLASHAEAEPATFADRLDACAFRHPVAGIARMADLSPAVRLALRAHVGPMAEKGETFNATDVIVLDPSTKTPVLPRTRFLRAGRWQDLVFVWYEAGGIALFHRLSLYRLGTDATTHVITDIFDDGRDPCALTDATLDAAKSQR